MDNKPLAEITEADLGLLVESSTREGIRLDYKRDNYKRDDAGTREFLSDVSSFANAHGGTLLIGVEEEDGCASEVVGIEGPMDEAIQRLNQKIHSGIEPRISGLQLHAIALSSGRHVLAIRMPKSWAGPHMVAFKNFSRFFSRTSSGKYQLDVAEIRAHFLGSDQLGEKIRRFRIGRQNDVALGSTALPMRQGPKLMLHLVPLVAFDPGFAIELPSIGDVNAMLQPIMSAGWSWRLNFDGLMTFTTLSDDEVSSYVQLFRNGVVEGVDSNLLKGWNGRLLISGTEFEQQLLQAVRRFMDLEVYVGLTPPTAWLLTLSGVREYAMAIGPGRTPGRHAFIDRDVLFVPEVIQQELQSPESIVRRLVDPVWQASGWECSPNFGDDDAWAPR